MAVFQLEHPVNYVRALKVYVAYALVYRVAQHVAVYYHIVVFAVNVALHILPAVKRKPQGHALAVHRIRLYALCA